MIKSFVILGAGPAGLGAARQLAKGRQHQVVVIEKNYQVGGNAGSFEMEGVFVDYGSHRLHPACDPNVLSDIRSLLGDDLLDRPRHGRILLQGRWIHFPLKPFDLLIKLPPKFSYGVVKDTLLKVIRRKPEFIKYEKFSTIIERGLGKTIAEDFYFPYARKIWGLRPDQMSAIQARRRVSAGSIKKMFQKIINAIPGIKTPGSGRFFYPRKGYGQISEAYYQTALQDGAEIILGATVKSIRYHEAEKVIVAYEKNGETMEILADHVWSTIPVTALINCLVPAPADEILNAASMIDFRSMILIYLIVAKSQFSEYDAHYFPGANIPITRLSEPKNYSGSQAPQGRTVLCAELPCSPEDEWWKMADEKLGDVVCDALSKAGIPIDVQLLGVQIKRLRYAYPIYRSGYEEYFNRIDAWIDEAEGILTFGRQGLFAHDNTHHALFMAYGAVDCIDSEGNFDRDKWHEYRKIFETHVVED
jgi:protoporphyrinogen oxidase